jgi:hypothetical protein
MIEGGHREAVGEEVEATAAVVRVATRGWPRRKTVRAAIGHAVEFETWRSLTRHHGLSRKQAVDAMVRLARAVG